MEAIKRVFGLDGGPPQKVAAVSRAMTIPSRTIGRWKRECEKDMAKGLKSKKVRKELPLPPEDWSRLHDLVLDEKPKDYDSRSGLWTRQAVRRLIVENFKLDVREEDFSLTDVGTILSYAGIAPSRGLRVPPRRTGPDADAKWTAEYDRLLKVAKDWDQDAKLYFIVESHDLRGRHNPVLTYRRGGGCSYMRKEVPPTMSVVDVQGSFWSRKIGDGRPSEEFLEFAFAFASNMLEMRPKSPKHRKVFVTHRYVPDKETEWKCNNLAAANVERCKFRPENFDYW